MANTKTKYYSSLKIKKIPNYKFELEFDPNDRTESFYSYHLICIPKDKKKKVIVFPEFFRCIKSHSDNWIKFLPSDFRECTDVIESSDEVNSSYLEECSSNLRYALKSNYDNICDEHQEYYSYRLEYLKKPTLSKIRLDIEFKNYKYRG
jgi:hypothetical protein